MGGRGEKENGKSERQARWGRGRWEGLAGGLGVENGIAAYCSVTVYMREDLLQVDSTHEGTSARDLYDG